MLEFHQKNKTFAVKNLSFSLTFCLFFLALLKTYFLSPKSKVPTRFLLLPENMLKKKSEGFLLAQKAMTDIHCKINRFFDPL